MKQIKDLEVDLGPEKKKVEEYLKDYMNDVDKVQDLTDKLSIDKKMLKSHIEKDSMHKEMQKLEDRKKIYEQRNEELEEKKNTKRFERQKASEPETKKEMIEHKEKFDWRHPIKSLKRLWNQKESAKIEKEANNNPNEITAVDKLVLREVEQSVKGMGKGFRYKYKVEEKDRISAEVENKLNTKREKYYADLEKQEAQKGSER